MPKNKRPKRIDTEAAAKWVEKNWELLPNNGTVHMTERGLRIIVEDGIGDKILDVPFSWLWKKRQPLTGITKRLKKAVRGKK